MNKMIIVYFAAFGFALASHVEAEPVTSSKPPAHEVSPGTAPGDQPNESTLPAHPPENTGTPSTTTTSKTHHHKHSKPVAPSPGPETPAPTK